jgi:hypothetical protein
MKVPVAVLECVDEEINEFIAFGAIVSLVLPNKNKELVS